MIFPDTHVKTPRVKTIIADEPAASPSNPSVKLAPFETAAIISTTKNINTIQVYDSKLGSIHVIKSE